MSVYDFEVRDDQGNLVSLKDYEGKVLLIVNSATECGFTPQYTELTEIYNEFKDEGFVILDFPCNQFGGQAPGTISEIKETCRLKFLVEYPIFDKIDVNGDNASELYEYLKNEKGFEGFDEDHELTPILDDIISKIDADYKNNNDIKWNFTKFLIDREGNVVARFEPTKDLSIVKNEIKELL
ncbi:glutathione peroxidase [Methanosphaera sp. WGK6]|uniref:glutathione peroxidase n=1 Tax=Methanosphaera sp. WGK6 TaxID=1561964 RepID=UPI00084C233A|nr:glutathione peroxidase [Methanosphaera sp. WGK6]OED29732.1 glutathione peroxidase [Methanosphaera sp. WGK6]